MATDRTKASELVSEVPLAVVDADRVPAARYYDQAFFDLECEHLWPRVWQMACRLDEIPNVGDFVEYENLGKSVIVVRTRDGGVTAFHNACRHRGVQTRQDRGCASNGFICPVPWLVLRPGRHEHLRLLARALSEPRTSSRLSSI